MATQSLYRRFRPRKFSELYGQDHVVMALRNAVINGREGQAYLFSGPRGTGKTTTVVKLLLVLQQLQQQQQARQQLDKLAHSDHLTGLANRLYFETELLCEREDFSVGVAICLFKVSLL